MKRKRSTSPSASSSSSPSTKERYDVLLSFRGEDTRKTFTGHLYRALCRVGLQMHSIFKDDIELDKGKEIGPELMGAIENSQYAVVVLSENYASSSWCLRELAQIVECMGDSGRIRTIFYHVNPSHVRNVISTDPEKQQESSFWKALEEHAQNPTHSEHLESWRNALVKVANQSGLPVEDHTDEATFIDEFVEKISRELGASIRMNEGLFGMDSRLEKLSSTVRHSDATNNKVCFIGIHGMGGIGKSTLALTYFKEKSGEFEGSSFLENIREKCEKETRGLLNLQKQLFKDTLKVDASDIGFVDRGRDMIRSRLHSKKVLIILDDVSKDEQLNALANEDKWFGFGSIIIVTSREVSFLKIRRYLIYKAESLDPSEALQLFSLKAFGKNDPPEQYKKLSKEVVKYVNCLPLALAVLGSLLGSKSTSEWRSAMSRLRKYPEKEIVDKLKISFYDLNEADQRIFLDIACFFKGHRKNEVIPILDACGFESEYGISNLIAKSLLSLRCNYGTYNLWMHDILQEMGKDIVRKESGNELARQSRIWNAVDLYHVLENKEGMNKVEAIVTHLTDESMECSFEGLWYLKKLRLLIIKDFGFWRMWEEPRLFKYLPNNLHYLQMCGFVDNEFPSSFQSLDNHMKPSYNLKVIDLRGAYHFRKFQDFTVVPNLERLILSGTEVSEIHPSIKHLKKLVLLDLSNCRSLEKLPEEMTGLTSLQTLNLRFCLELRELPHNLDLLKSLREFDITDSGITHLPSSIFLMENLESLSCTNEELAETIIRETIMKHRTRNKCVLSGSSWSCIKKLDLVDCNLTDQSLPGYFGDLQCLIYLDLSKNPFTVLPIGISELDLLRYLKLEYCKQLRRLEAEHLPSKLVGVYVNYCTSLSSFLDPFKPCKLQSSALHCLDCTELTKRQDGTMTALACLRRYLDSDLSTFLLRRDEFSIVFPLLHPRIDYRLPSWFNHQSSTATVVVRLDPYHRNKKLIGVAMAICSAANPSASFFYCRIMFSHTTVVTRLGFIEGRFSNHFSVHYLQIPVSPLCFEEDLKSPSCEYIEFSFYSLEPANVELALCTVGSDTTLFGPCGIRLVYEEDIEELNEIVRKYTQKDRVHSSSFMEDRRTDP